MQRCWGFVKFRRCKRYGDWKFYCHDHMWQPLKALFVLVFTVLAGIASIQSAWFSASQPNPKLSDVTLRFVYPKSPTLILVNQSAVTARDVKWTVVLWNMDLPDRDDPLPIPVGTFDWIKPYDKGGPQNLFDRPSVVPLLKPGNRLFGSASVDCPECARGRTYIVHIVWGDSGWFAEVENEKSGKIIVPINFLKASRSEYFTTLEAAIPAQLRTPIGEK